MASNPYPILLERILFGDYLPGVALVEQEIAAELGISRTPVREALLRLRLEGLVRIIPRGGFFVVEVTVQKIREITEVRLVLEETLARLAAARRDELLLTQFRGWLEGLEPIWDQLTPREWMQKDNDFHQFMDRAAGNGTLSNQIAILRRQAVLFWGQAIEGRSSLGSVLEDFKRALMALEKRDPELCVKALRLHVLDHIERIQSFMNPDSALKSAARSLYKTGATQ